MPMSASRIFFARCSSKGWWGNVDHHYLLPLTRVELGDALGISEVYANRMLRRLQDEKLIVSERRTMRIPDLEALKAAAAFDHATSTWTARCGRCGIRSRRRAGCHMCVKVTRGLIGQVPARGDGGDRGLIFFWRAPIGAFKFRPSGGTSRS